MFVRVQEKLDAHLPNATYICSTPYARLLHYSRDGGFARQRIWILGRDDRTRVFLLPSHIFISRRFRTFCDVVTLRRDVINKMLDVR